MLLIIARSHYFGDAKSFTYNGKGKHTHFSNFILFYREILELGLKRLEIRFSLVIFYAVLRLIRQRLILKCKMRDMLQSYCLKQELKISHQVYHSQLLQMMWQILLLLKTISHQEMLLAHQKQNRQQNQLQHQLQLLQHQVQQLKLLQLLHQNHQVTEFLSAHQLLIRQMLKVQILVKFKEQVQEVELLKLTLMKPYKLVHQDLKLPQQLFLTVFQLQDTWIFKILKLEK